MRLNQLVTIITGGASGIGRAAVVKFAQEGALPVIFDVNAEIGNEFAKSLPNSSFFQVNVTDPESVQKAVKEVLAKYGRIDVLINNAGITRDGQLVKWRDGQVVNTMDETAFDQVIDVNLKGVFNCTKAVVPSMIARKKGVIISTSSIVGVHGNFGQTNYAATKAGVIGMTKVWARELGKYGIRVNAVAPGFIHTDMTRKMPEQVLADMAKHTPLGRLGDPEDVANVYCWLASDEAAYVHGAVISVDGGLVPGT
jgi:3-oxoacyl-[acyl-carrier protein] reductase